MKVGAMFHPLSLGFTDHHHHHHHPVTHHQAHQAQRMLIDDDGEDEISQSDEVMIMGQVSSNAVASLKKAEIRKSNKPIMEKKRRARINNCLNDLKAILLEAMRKDPARHSKLEKADILELTVRHLQNVQRNQLAIAMASDPTVLHRFKNGFSECLTEMNRYMGKLDGVDQGIRQRLTNYLSTCVNGLQQVNSTPSTATPFGGSLPPPSQIPTPHYSPIVPGPTNNTSASAPSFGQQHSIPIPTGTNMTQPISQDLNNNKHVGESHIIIHSIQRPLLNPSSVNRHFSSAFSTVQSGNNNKRTAMRNSSTPPPIEQQPPLLLISPPSTSESSSCDTISTTPQHLNNSSISSGSDISICTGSEKGTNTSPNSFALARAAATATTGIIGSAPVISNSAGSSPIDFSLKYKEKSSVVRVLKVEPMMTMGYERDSSNDDEDSALMSTILTQKDNMWRPW